MSYLSFSILGVVDEWKALLDKRQLQHHLKEKQTKEIMK
jgi:hypothetical protein